MIDAHVHIFPPYRSAGAVRWLKRAIPWMKVDETISETDILETLDFLGVSHFFNYVYPLSPGESRSLNEFNCQLSKRVKKAICFGSVHPGNNDRKEIVEEAILDFGLIGLKFHPFVQGFDILDDRMDTIYQTMERLNRPIVFHTGFDNFYGVRMRPEAMDTLLTRHPELVVVIAHMFYPDIEGAFKLLRKHNNVYLDGSNIFSGYREPADGENVFEGKLVRDGGTEQYAVYFHHSLKELEEFSHRIMFGSDYPLCMNDLGRIYDTVRSLDISGESIENISERTAMQFVERFEQGFFPAKNP